MDQAVRELAARIGALEAHTAAERRSKQMRNFDFRRA